MIDRYELGSFFGSLSIGFWLLVQAVQIKENYDLKSGEGLSMFFIFIWLLGDSTNLVGAAIQGLLPTMTYLALYYVFCDFVLIGQVVYYRRYRSKHPEEYPHLTESDEQTALLASESKVHLHETPDRRKDFTIFALCMLFVVLAGIVGLSITSRDINRGPPNEAWDDNAQIIGWTSAILYLTSRFPQIVKNISTKCEGLSLMFFFFALMGNVTFCLSIVIVSTSTDHLMINLAWLIGAGGTVVLDFVVLGQFAFYAADRKRARMLAEHEDIL